MKIDKNRWEPKRLKISSLKPYTAQEAVFGGTTRPSEDEALACDLQERGQLDPAHVMPNRNKAGLPPGTVVDGWRRAIGMQAKGNTELDCYIRHDLKDATAAEVAAEFVKYNFHRRQLSGLARARCIKHLMEVEAGSGGRLDGKGLERLKTQIGEHLGIGLRTVNRYLLVLKAVAPVQQAFEHGLLPLVDAGKIATMSQDKQRAIATRLANGEPSKTVLEEYYRERDGAYDGVGGAFQYFTNALSRSWGLLQGRVSQIKEFLLLKVSFVHREAVAGLDAPR